MSILEIVLLGSGLAMDASSVAMADGMAECGMKLKKALVIATIFGIFQGLMPILGFYSGGLFQRKAECDQSFHRILDSFVFGPENDFEAREKKKFRKGSIFRNHFAGDRDQHRRSLGGSLWRSQGRGSTFRP